MKKIIAGLTLVIILLSGCTSAPQTPESEQKNSMTENEQKNTDQNSLATLLGMQPIFANAEDVYVSEKITPEIKESESDPMKAINLEIMQKALNFNLTDKEKDFLQKNKFLLLDRFDDYEKFCFGDALNSSQRENCKTSLAMTTDEMVGLFTQFSGERPDYLRNGANSVYINSDIILHAYHVFLDRYIKYLEEKELYPLLSSVIDKMQQEAFSELQKASSSSHSEEKDALERVAGYLTLGKVLLETKASEKPSFFNSLDEEENWRKQDQEIDKSLDPFQKNLEKYKNNFSADYYQKLQDEIKLVFDAKSLSESPIFMVYNPKSPTDYTQFTPRSHYNKDSLLRAYFRAMMLFGRQSFNFGSKEGLQDSAILSLIIQNSGVEKDWEKFSDVTDFFAGASDDITYKQFKTTFKTALGENATFKDIFMEDSVQKLKQETAKLPVPKILSEVVIDSNMENLTKEDLLNSSKGLRLFGQKFTFDAWVLNRMTAGQEDTKIKLPSTPSALFVAGVMGSDLVEKLLPTWIQTTDNVGLDASALWKEMTSIRSEFAIMEPQDWLSNISSAWLWTLSPLLQEYGQGYPAFMQSVLYQNKNLQTVLGSYTELKHDTLLYAKQSYAELGGFGSDERTKPEIAKGFVEPDLEFWNRIIALTKMTREGLASRDLLDETADAKLKTFMDALLFYKDFTKKELTNEKISDEEYEKLRADTWKISDLIAPFEGETVIDEKDKKSALIADIHTDALEGQILYEATGKPLIMLAFVSDQNMPRLVIGLAFRHFELTGPIDKRYTDEEWKERVDKKDLPETPFFYQDLFVK